MGSRIFTRMTKHWGILGLLLAFCGCSDSTVPQNIPLESPNSLNPREVPSVTIGHGPNPGEAAVSWWFVNWSTFPIEEYFVALSGEGPITEANWSDAEILGGYPQRQGQLQYREIFGASDGLEQGATIWIAVRARDARGNLSRLKESPHLTLTTAWWIEGRVLDVQGNPISGSEVRSLFTGGTDHTDLAGAYRLGPFRNIDTIELVTDGATPEGSWYGFRHEPLRSLPGQTLIADQDVFLIRRHALDPVCTLPDAEFLTYLRDMTLTSEQRGNAPSTILNRWNHYPLTVYIPDEVNEAGVPMDEGALAALLIWNDAMGEDYFLRTDQKAGADLEFIFREMNNFYGLISITYPSGPGVELGRVVPEKMAVFINPVLPDLKTVAEISLHELGHTLGLYNHADCQAAGYLMKIAGGFGSLDREEPIHLDERRAVAAIRHLPQGQDMSRYWINDAPGP